MCVELENPPKGKELGGVSKPDDVSDVEGVLAVQSSGIGDLSLSSGLLAGVSGGNL